VAHQLSPIGRWIEQRGDLGFGQLLSAHQLCLPGRIRPADQPIRARESMSVLRRMSKIGHTVILVAPPSSGAGHAVLADFRGPAPERSQFVRLCYKNWPFVSSGLVGPGFAGAAQALTITLTPPVAKIEGQTQILGRAVSSQASNSRLDLVQTLGTSGHTVATRLSFEAEAVLRYEVTDWRGQRPTETSIEGASPVGEHFYGFGEKFDHLDQGGKTVLPCSGQPFNLLRHPAIR
jgi:hypothetical protein